MFPPPKTRGFFKYYINNKYKQLNIRTMAESFEGKKISNPLANLRPQKMQYGAKIGGFGKVNRQRFSQHCKGIRCYGMYTDTNKTSDFTQDLLQKRTPPMRGSMV
jgi:hypothetical protein